MSNGDTTQQADPLAGILASGQMDKLGSTTPSTTGGGQQDPMTEAMRRLQQSQLVAPPKGGGHQLFIGGILGLAAAGIQAQKQKQLDHATGVMSQLNNSWMKAQELSGGDQEKAKELFHSMPEVTHILEDKKNVKQLGKLLEMDFMNPEKKKTVWHEALAKVATAGEKLGLVRALKKSVDKRKEEQDQQQSEADKEQQARSIADRIVSGTAQRPTDAKATEALVRQSTEMVRANADLLRAQTAAREKYNIVGPASDGHMYAIDKSNPRNRVRLTDPEGEPIKETPKGGGGVAGKTATVNGVPVGISKMVNGRMTIVRPGDKDWTSEDTQTFEKDKAAYAVGQKEKERIANIHQSYFGSLPQAVLLKRPDPAKGLQAGELSFVTRQEAAAHPELYAPPGEGTKALNATARFGEIQATADMVSTAIDRLPDDAFDTKARAQIAAALRAPDPKSAVSIFMSSEIATTLTDAQIDYVTGLASFAESAQAMSSIQGIGARGSDMLRSAIVRMLPSGSTPSRAYAKEQMRKFQVEVDALKKGVAKLGLLTDGAGGTTGGGSTPAPTGDIQFTPFKK